MYQKTYTTDSLPLKRYLNTGQRSKYYAMETHEGIISKTDYEKVQNLLAKKSITGEIDRTCVFSKKIYCSICGAICSRKGPPTQGFVWCCRTHLQSKALCLLKSIREDELQQAFLSIYNRLQCNQKTILEPLVDDLLGLRHLQEQKYKKRLALGEDIQHLAKQKHNLTRIHTLGYIEPFTHTQTPALASRKRLLMRVLLFGKVSYYTMDTGSRIKLVREHRGLTQQKLGEMLGYGKSSANRIAQYEMGYRSPKANRLKEIAKAMNIREEIFLMPDETPIDLLRILIWYDWEHEGVLQLATSRTANTPPGKTVSPIIYSEQLPLNRLLLDWADQKHSLSVRKITRADYLEWMLQWPPRLP